jgi:RNA polymerase sigma-70 factor, ECF subfamily
MDVQEFQTFYQEKFGLIYRYVYSQVGKREETEDLTSEIFLKAVSRIKYEHSPQSRHKWLYLIARSCIADYWRTHYRLPTSSLEELFEVGWEGPTEEGPVVISGKPKPEDRVQHLLQALPARYQEVLTCRFLLNLSIKDTATRMGMSVSGVKVLQFRALRRAADLEQAASV